MYLFNNQVKVGCQDQSKCIESSMGNMYTDVVL